jgi:HEPN domain-containing protein
MKEKTKNWLAVAENDMAFAEEIVANGKRPQYAVHFCHQAIEKVLKACVQEKTTEDPKRTHNFKLLCQQGNFNLPPHIEEFLARLAPHYLSSKYPEDLKQYYRDYTLDVAKEWVSKTREVFTWFKQLMIS